jgi:hypothetical protein
MAHIGHPVTGDRKYQQTKKVKTQLHWCPRLFLHAKHVELWAEVVAEGQQHSVNGGTTRTKLFAATAELSPDLKEVLSKLVPVAAPPLGPAPAPAPAPAPVVTCSEHADTLDQPIALPGSMAITTLAVVIAAVIAAAWFARRRQ